MALYFIGLGLNNQDDITLRGLEAAKKCDVVYFESYTSRLNCSISALERLFGKKVKLAGRNAFEEDGDAIINEARFKDVALLVVGDPFSATTHADLFIEARRTGVHVEVIHNASVLNAVGITGLQLYKFGKTTSIPYENENVRTPYDVLAANRRSGMHTLFLLDIKSDEQRYMSVNEAIKYLLSVEEKWKKHAFSKETLCVGCARLGSDNFMIKSGTADELMGVDFGHPMHCLIVPGKLHFKEEEALELWR